MALDRQGNHAHHAQFQVDGMTCASCVGRVQKAIEKVPGVVVASVNLATETADVQFGDAASPQQITDAITSAGYATREELITLGIEGMTCASCVGRVERALGAAPGVIEATVNLAAETAQVRYGSGLQSAATLAGIVDKAGYTARVAQDVDSADRDARRDAEITALGHKVAWAVVLGLPVFVLAMGAHFIPGMRDLIAGLVGMRTSWAVQFILTTLVMAGPGRVFLLKGFPALWRLAPDMNSLVALGTTAAWIFSTAVLFVPGVIPVASRGVYFEAAAVIVTLILFGRWLEARAKGRTGAAIRHLVGLRPKSARRETNGVVSDVPLEDVRSGDILHLRPGESIAVDGEVIDGSSHIDESMITGEPLPVKKSTGDPVTGGTINTTGSIRYRATHVGADTVLASIIRMVEQAQGAKLPIQALVDKVTLWFVPVVLGVAALTFAVWLALGPDLVHALVASVAVLIIACPCAMGLATPTSIMVGTGRGAELGVLFRKGDALQSLSKVRVVVFDKTGTLTEGKPVMTDFQPAQGVDAARALAAVAALESRSEHPIAAAILAAAKEQDLTLPDLVDFGAEPGYGVCATLDGQTVAVGADRYMKKLGVEIGALADASHALAAEGKTPIFAAQAGHITAVLAVADRVKDSTPAAIKALKSLGLRVAMLTGDNAVSAAVVASSLGIDDVVAEVLPGGKVDSLVDLGSKYGPVAFVGDGINDAPALAHADVGIAIGTGTDVAIESADVVLMSGDLGGVPRAIRLSRSVMTNIRQNLFWAFGYNALLIPVAAGALYPVYGLLLSPMIAAGAMGLSSVFVLSNALRLRTFKFNQEEPAA